MPKSQYLLILSLLFVFSGCGTYQWRKAERPVLQSYEAMQGDIVLMVAPLSDTESWSQFKVNLRKKKYQALHLYLENRSDDYYVLHPWNIKLPLVPPKQVARDFYTNVPLAVFLMLEVGWLGLVWFHPLSYFIPVGVYGIFAFPEGNRAIKKRLKNKTMERGKESIVLPPHGCVEYYVFIKEQDALVPFNVTCQNQRTIRSISFTVSLSADSIAT